MQLHSKKGFTLVEIMIVVVIIGLLAAMAIPAFNRVRKQSRQTALVSDGRIIGNAAQQYFLTSGKSVATFTYTAATGEVTGDLTPWVKTVGKNYTITGTPIDSDKTDAFYITQDGAFGFAVPFSDEGKTTADPNQP